MAEEYLTKAGLAYFYSKLDLKNSVARIKYNTSSGWDAQITLISELHTIYVYTDYYSTTDSQGQVQTSPGIKIGDGLSYLIDIPMFSCDCMVDTALTQSEIDTIFT